LLSCYTKLNKDTTEASHYIMDWFKIANVNKQAAETRMYKAWPLSD